MIQKELWANKVSEFLFPDNAFYKNAINDSAFIEGHAVHIPQAGALTKATKNRSSLPASIGKRDDSDLVYLINEFSADPIVVTNIEEVEASYDKLASVTSQLGKSLYSSLGDWVAYEWSTNANIVETTGDDRAVYLSTQTGTRKELTYNDILKAMRILNIQNVPMENRKMLIDGYMYEDLLKLPEFKSSNEIMTNVLTAGSIGKIAGADVFLRTPSIIYTTAGVKKLPDATADVSDNLGLLIWHPDFVRVAQGNVVVFGKDNDPEYYGSIVSALVRFGATKGYTLNDMGVVNIIEAA